MAAGLWRCGLLRLAMCTSTISLTRSTAPARMPAPQLIAITSTTISVTWSLPVEDGGTPVGAYVLHGGSIGGPLRPIYDPLPGEPDRNYTVRNLWPRTTYVFQVVASNSAGRSASSVQAIFTTTAPVPTISLVTPSAGPERGGTFVRVQGADLAFGTVYRCRFGDQAVPATLTEAALPELASMVLALRRPAAEADYGDNGRGTLVCATPRSPGRYAWSVEGERSRLTAHNVPLAIALDGTSFWTSAPPHMYYESPQPVLVSPRSGPLAGGTFVTVTGTFPRTHSWLYDRGAGGATAEAHAMEALEALSTVSSSAAEGEGNGHFPGASCNFGGAVVPALLGGKPANATPLILFTPPPPFAPPLYNASNAVISAPSAPPESPSGMPPPSPASPSLNGSANSTLLLDDTPAGAPLPHPPKLDAPADYINCTLLCVVPFAGEGLVTTVLRQALSFGEQPTSIAALDEFPSQHGGTYFGSYPEPTSYSGAHWDPTAVSATAIDAAGGFHGDTTAGLGSVGEVAMPSEMAAGKGVIASLYHEELFSTGLLIDPPTGFAGEGAYRLAFLPSYSLLPTAHCPLPTFISYFQLPTPYSLLPTPTPYSLPPTPYSILHTPCTLFRTSHSPLPKLLQRSTG